MSEAIDITKPVWTKRGGVVTELRNEYTHKFCLHGTETLNGNRFRTAWTLEGIYSLKAPNTELDLTNTPPAKSEEPMSNLIKTQDLNRGDVTDEQWREYDWTGRSEPYRIDNPTEVRWRTGGATHRIIDSAGIVHCVPAPGVLGCVLRWKNREGSDPCNW